MSHNLPNWTELVKFELRYTEAVQCTTLQYNNITLHTVQLLVVHIKQTNFLTNYEAFKSHKNFKQFIFATKFKYVKL